jgi:hypothetical protein
MPQERQRDRELRMLGMIVFALPRAVRWFYRQFMLGVRAGMATAEQRPGRPQSGSHQPPENPDAPA